MAVPKVEVVVLGLLAEDPMHGYDLLERYRGRSMDLWSGVGRASVYQALRRLEAGGYVTGKDQAGDDGPDRRVYRITRPGRDRLRAGLLERLADDAAYEVPAATALGFAHLLTADEARKGAAQREAAANALLSRIAADRERAAGMKGPAASLAARMLDEQEAFARAELAWLVTYRKDLGRIRR
jgi:DNA-binding PadR family transcriptional regulator